MVDLTPPFRRATPDDAQALAELVDFASEGLALYLWAKIAGPGGDPWAVGRERARRETGAFSYRNAVVLEREGRVAAALIGYPLPDAPEPIPDTMPAMFVPLQELENLAPGHLVRERAGRLPRRARPRPWHRPAGPCRAARRRSRHPRP